MIGRKIIGIIVMFFTVGFAFSSGNFEGISETGVKILRVEGAMVSVEVTGNLGRSVEGRAYDIPDNVEIKYERLGNTVRVWVDKRFSLFSNRGNPVLRFEVPRTTGLDISTASGDISIEAMTGDALIAASSSGDIEIGDVRSDLRSQTSSGDLRISRANGDIHVESSSGEIELREVVGDVVGSASSGDIELNEIRGDITISTTSGSIDIDDINGAVRASSSSGSISGDHVQINGDSRFASTSGAIKIDFDNPLETLSFRLTASSGNLRVGDISGSKSLSTGSGRFLIQGETSSGSQRYE